MIDNKPNNIRVSIIITGYNYGRFVKDAIESALSQTYNNTEVIVVNDGSTDNSHYIISEFTDRVVYINQTNLGVAAARNNGISAATGTYCCCLDADDWISPSYVFDSVKLIKGDNSIISPISFFADENLNLIKNMKHPDIKVRRTCNNTLKSILQHNRLSACSIFPKIKFQQVGGYNQKSCVEDYQLWIDLILVGCEMYYLDENIVHMKYRKHGPSRIDLFTQEEIFEYIYTKYGIFQPTYSKKQKIEALYRLYFDREADIGGLNHYLNSHYGIQKIAMEFFLSEEYLQKNIKNC
jgi:glycosyltransferase involved in cell wall biosynthesis